MTSTEIVFNFNASGKEEIIQNVRMILGTPAGSVPFDREFGIDISFLDLPFAQAQARMTAEYVRKVRRFEPRARVERVDYTNDPLNGSLNARVVINLV